MLYVAAREFGGRSIFGENSLSELSDNQRKLLMLSQLYDVVRTSTEPDDVTIPDEILPYPTKLNNWYNEHKEEKRKQRMSDKPSGKEKRSSKDSNVLIDDNESREDIIRAFARGDIQRNLAKPPEQY